MDTVHIQETGEQKTQWLQDQHKMRCCKMAMRAANGVMLMALTLGVGMLCLMELRKARCCHHHCHTPQK